MFVKEVEGDALLANKNKFKGKSRGISHTRSLGDPEKKEESSNYYDKRLLRCYRGGNIGHIKWYCRAKESNVAQKVAEEQEEWEPWLAVEARAIDAMISINAFTINKGYSIDISLSIFFENIQY